jgi:hypothetical protein
MDRKDILFRLKEASLPIIVEEEEEKKAIEKEVIALIEFVSEVSSFGTKKNILGKDCILIYIYDASRNDTISNDVYLHPDGYVTYQVYDEPTYRGFVPDADFENGFVKIRIDHFIRSIPLYEIMFFFDSRPQKLLEQRFDIAERTKRRNDFVKKISRNN